MLLPNQGPRLVIDAGLEFEKNEFEKEFDSDACDGNDNRRPQ